MKVKIENKWICTVLRHQIKAFSVLLHINLNNMPFQFDKGNKEESNIDSFTSDDNEVVSDVDEDELNRMVQVCYFIITFAYIIFPIKNIVHLFYYSKHSK